MSVDTAKATSAVVNLPVDMLDDHPDNPRTDSWNIAELVDSIRQLGVLTPLIVRAVDNARFQILAGHRRARAARELGLFTAPCVVVAPVESEVWTILLAENMQRQNLNLIEEAKAYKTLRARGLTILAIANRLGLPEQRVSRRLALLELPVALQAEVISGDLNLREAWKLVSKNRNSHRGPIAGDGRGGRSTKYHEHFNQGHPLASEAAKVCDDAGHEVPSRLGPACGRCWEEAIRDDQHLTTWYEMEIDDDPPPPRAEFVAHPDEASA